MDAALIPPGPPSIEPEDLVRPSGRGLLLMKSFMDSVTFNPAGNEVTLVKRKAADSHSTPRDAGRHNEDRAAAVDGLLFPASPAEGKTDAATKGTAPCVNGKQQPEAPPSAPLNELLTLDFDFYKRLLDQLHDAVVLRR